ncbi:MAG: hypothetical protein WBD28_04735, partial [Candidatus Zixiibacteriota bacterium]
LLAQKERELSAVNSKLEAMGKSVPLKTESIPLSWIKDKVTNLKELFDQYPDKIYLLRQEIKRSLINKVVMRPRLSKSDQRFYIAEVSADPLSLLGTTPIVSLIGHSATGSRTPV